MSFINSFFLYFLPLISIPIILHWLNKQNFRTIEFSTLQFLSQLETSAIKKLRVKKILLLILRTLIILFIILAFARPVIEVGKSGTKVGQGRKLYLLLDNSASMKKKKKGQSLLEVQKDKVLKLAEEQVYPINIKIITTTEPGKISYDKMVSSREEIKNLLDKIKPTDLEGKIIPALNTIEKSNQNLSPAVWILSDFQSTRKNFSTKLNQQLVSINQSRLVLFPENIETENYSIQKVEFPDQLVGRDSELLIRVDLDSEQGDKEIPLSLFIQEERRGRVSVDFSQKSNSRRDFQVKLGRTGLLTGRVELPSDDFMKDNQFYFSLNIPDQYKVLVVGEENSETRFLINAIEAGQEDSYQVERINSNQFGSKDLDQYNILVLSGEFDVNLDLLNSFVEQKKGIFILPGEEDKKQEYNEFARKMELPQWIETKNYEESNFIKLAKVDSEHPILQNLWQGRKEQFARYFKIPVLDTSKGYNTTLEYENGSSFLMLSEGEINSAIMATNPNSVWTDMQYTGFFPALVKRTLAYLGGQLNFKYNYETGDTINIDKMNIEQGGISILTPEGKEYYPTQEDAHSIFSETSNPGIYEVMRQGRSIAKFAVNIPEKERICKYLTDNELKDITEDTESLVNFNIEEEKSQRSYYELSHILIAIVILLAGVEVWVARTE